MMQIPDNIADEELISYLKKPETSEAAFSLLMDRYTKPLYLVIRRIVLSHDDADDVLQNTFIKIWKNISSYRGDSKLMTWMYSIATNEALSHMRREKNARRLPLTTDSYDLAQTLIGDPSFDGDEVEAQLYAAIDQLPEKQKVTFQMRYFEELPYSDIAEVTGTSIGALKANYHHAVNKLQKFLGLDSKD